MQEALSNKLYKNYLNTKQRGTVRLEEGVTPSHIKGLCTDGLGTCLGIIIMPSEGTKNRISLTHVDMAVDEQAIINECQWVGASTTIFLVRGNTYSNPAIEAWSRTNTTLIQRLEKAILGRPIKIDYRYFSQFTFALAVTKKGELKFPKTPLIFGCTQAPDWQLRLDINNINVFARNQQPAVSYARLGANYAGLDLQFDGAQWTPMPALTPEGAAAIKNPSSLSGPLAMHANSYNKQIGEFNQRKKESKREALPAQGSSARSSFFALKSATAEDYALRLQDILGEHAGSKIVEILPDAKKTGGKIVSFSSFWLKQLGPEAIEELSQELSINPRIIKA
jgi:hypothetical protein